MIALLVRIRNYFWPEETIPPHRIVEVDLANHSVVSRFASPKKNLEVLMQFLIIPWENYRTQ